MSPRTCSSVRRRLSLYVDGELGGREQLEVGAHLRECQECAAEEREMRDVGDVLRAHLPSMDDMESDVLDGLASTVVSRVRAEREESVAGRLGRVFDDMHLLWAGLGATGATVACSLMMIGLSQPLVQPHPNSFSSIMTALGSPGSNSNPVSLNRWVRPPRMMEDQLYPPMVIDAEDETPFLVYTILTREGSVSHSTILQAPDHANRQQVLDLLDSMARARFEPARYGISRSAVAVKCMMLFSQLTVRGKMPSESQVVPSIMTPPDPTLGVLSVTSA